MDRRHGLRAGGAAWTPESGCVTDNGNGESEVERLRKKTEQTPPDSAELTAAGPPEPLLLRPALQAERSGGLHYSCH